MISYLDNAATTPLCQMALEKITDVAANHFGNPSSLHSIGLDAENIIEEARKNVIYAFEKQNIVRIHKKEQIIFTSGGTESNNLAILGAALSKPRYMGKKVIVNSSEHASVNEAMKHLQSLGFKIVEIGTKNGVFDLDSFEKELDDNVVLVSSMLVNNETGALYDIKSISNLARRKAPNAIIHVDAIQGFCKFKLKENLDVDLISVSSHKIGGPKGVGALYISEATLKKANISPIIYGGGQESGIRSGTENVIGIAGFGAAAKYYADNLEIHQNKFKELKDYLFEEIKKVEVRINEPTVRINHIISITVPGIRSETMLHFLSSLSVYVSSGSACSSNTRHKSSALTAFGLIDNDADCTIRVSFGIQTTKEDIDNLICGLDKGIRGLQKKKTRN